MVINTVSNAIKNSFSFKKQIWIRAVFKELLCNLISCMVFFRRIFIKAKFKIRERTVEIFSYIVWVRSMFKQELNCSKVVVIYGFTQQSCLIAILTIKYRLINVGDSS